ncbi:MAG: hypothetical protein E7566_06835 [Ruminococcaceae bacterium]|nr:hypothetical protein [Oscillospiraceae bacterium]
MKKILAFLLSFIMVISMGSFSFSAQEADTENSTGIGVTSDEASKDEDDTSEATTDEATFDESALTQLVWEYMLKQMGGVNRFEGDRPWGNYEISYTIDMVCVYQNEATVDYAVFDINFDETDSEVENADVKIGDRIYTNEIHYGVSCYLGLGYYVVIPETEEVLILEDAVKANFEDLKDWCDEEGIARKIGDADADGEITVRDATYIQKFLAGVEGYVIEDIYAMFCYAYSDFDGDYKVNVKDVTNIQKYLADLPFNYWRNEGITSTDIPEDAEKLDCDVKLTEKYFREKEVAEYITNTEEYFGVFGENSDVYTEEFFENNNLVFVNKVFGSGCIDYEVKALYKQGDAIYFEGCIVDLKPGCGYTDDMKYVGCYVEVSKELTQGINKLFLYEDVLFEKDYPIF